ncbi:MULTISPECIES: sulfatase-like hydrolase/transferase [Gracilibacillus]|uniref:sulfatase-like hydrolase/transferase n=1 Tax=Gracilibacillus TaxID=74385 RepID=UPI0008257D82|nr:MULTISPECIES: sulfatase-like hydrolase/transferase [Gracilibacillus]
MGKPNFIIIYADDLGYGDLSCYGSNDVKTPNLDRLSEQGVRFTNWYSNSSVCSPSRASLMTGRYPGRTGVSEILRGKRGTSGLPSDEITLASYFKNRGYKTGIFGKWHLGVAEDNAPNAHGFDEFFGFLAGCVDYYSHIFYWEQGDGPNGTNPVHDLWHNQDEVWRNGQYMTEIITQKAVQFVESHVEEPFLMYVPYNAPHYPMHAPQKYLDRFPDLPADKRIMAAMISAMDDGVGEIMNTLEENGLLDDTVIFFSSDNGPSTESRNYLDGTEDVYYGGSAGKFRGHKDSLFDGGIREPAILSYPKKIPSGQISDELGVMMDIFPTFIDIADEEIPEDRTIDGESVFDMAVNRSATPHEKIFWAESDQYAVRKGDWKLVLNGRLYNTKESPDPVHLSNIKDDPGERINLKESYPSIVEELINDIKEWEEDLN